MAGPPVTIAPQAELAGVHVRLRRRTVEDTPLFVKWYNDPDVLHWLHLSEAPAATTESERERFEMSEHDPTRLTWVIETLDGRPIGNVSLIAVDHLHGRADLGIGIGEPDCWGRGYGTDAIRALLRHAFGPMGLRRVTLITDADNERGIRCYEKCGFVREGLLRGHRLRYGQPVDMLAMAVLAGEGA
jgi:RimJ/RimL family protein N-acetyltransferase